MKRVGNGATTLSIKTLSITVKNVMIGTLTHSITVENVMLWTLTHSITAENETLSKMTQSLNDTQHNDTQYYFKNCYYQQIETQ